MSSTMQPATGFFSSVLLSPPVRLMSIFTCLAGEGPLEGVVAAEVMSVGGAVG